MKFKKLGLLGLGMCFLLFLSSPSAAQYAPYYVLDGYGGVHAGGGASTVSPATPYFGWDIAKAVEYVPVAYSNTIYGDGVLVLDGFGGVHRGGKMASIGVTTTPYFGFNIARDVVYKVVDAEAYGVASTSTTTINTSGMKVLMSFYVNNPDQGWVYISANAMLWQTSSTSGAAVRYGIGIDSSTVYNTATHRWASMGTGTDAQSFYPHAVAATGRIILLSAGRHYFYFLIERVAGTGTVIVSYPTMSAIYINKNYNGASLSIPPAGDQKLYDDPVTVPDPNIGQKK